MINKEMLKVLKKKYKNNIDNNVRERILNKVEIKDLITDKNTNCKEEFNIFIKTHGVTNQKNSGRCWIFGGLNILREEIIKNCNLENFELSESYISFYDKLEKFYFLEINIMKRLLQNKNIYDKELSDLLKEGVDDGGYFTGFKNLVKKYGIVPKNVYPESYHSSNTEEVNQILNRLIKKYYLEISNNINKRKKIINKYLEYTYKILSNLFGIIIDKFNFEYIDKNGIYHIDKNLSPKKFYEKYVDINLLSDYIEINSYEDSIFKHYELYEVENTSRIIGYKDNIILNLPHNEIKRLIIKQLKKGELVYFSTSTPNKIIDGVWIDVYLRYGQLFDIDLELNNNDIIKTNETTGEHVMIFSGAKILNNKVYKWRIENSWGEQEGDNGYFTADNDFVDKYVFNIVINKKYLTKKELNILNKNPIKIKNYKY